MCTLATDERKTLLRHSTFELCFAGFLAFFGAVYEHYSFGVWSGYMVYAFAYPFAAGLFLLFMSMKGKRPGGMFLAMLHSAAVTFGVGSAAAGVVAIYGTENRLLKVYPIAGGVLLLAAIAAYFAGKKIADTSKMQQEK